MTRLAIALSLTATALAQTPSPAPLKASIAGVVRDAATGASISEADVVAAPADGPSQSKRVSVTTDSQGRYAMRGVEPGQVRVFASAGTPLRGASAFKVVSLNPGQEIAALDFHLRANGQISGKVFDENKEPVPGIAVFLVAREYNRGALRYVFANMSITDDQGAYTLTRATPGRAFLLMAEKRTFKLNPISDAPAEIRLRRPAVVPTYYPGSKSVEGAEAFVLGVGEHRENIDIRLLRAPSYCVEGTLDGALRFEIAARQPTSGTSGNGGFYAGSPGATTAANGKMRVCDLAPGDYTLTVMESTTGMTAPSFFGTTPVTILNEDVRSLSAPARPRLPVPGEVVWDGAPPDQPVDARITLVLDPLGRNRMGEDLAASATLPGQFSFTGLFLGPFSLQFRGIPAGLYLKDVTYNDRSILYEPLNVGSAMGNASLRVIVARDGGAVTVKVADKDNHPVADSYVVIAPGTASSEAMLAAALVRGQTDQNGMWTSAPLAPGKYFAVASAAEFDLSPESIAKIWRARTLAAEIDLAPKAKLTVTVEPKTLN